jgi:DNA polymerase-3 subunit gamma/tau
MKQQGSLLSFDGNAARIGISSKPLFKMAQGRVANVEEAFQQIVQRKVTVSLEVLPDPKPDEPAPTMLGAAQPPMGGDALASAPPPMPSSPPPPPRSESAAPLPAEPTAPARQPEGAPTPNVITTSVEGNGTAANLAPHPSLPEIASDFDRAVKNFAQFFNGQVVDLEDEVDALISGGRQPSEAAANQPSHPDKDVPF